MPFNQGDIVVFPERPDCRYQIIDRLAGESYVVRLVETGRPGGFVERHGDGPMQPMFYVSKAGAATASVVDDREYAL